MSYYKGIDPNPINFGTDFAFRKSEAEIIDLKRFWEDISWWERDDSLSSAIGFLNSLQFVKLPANLEIRRINDFVEINRLSNLNSKDRPSNLQKIIGKFVNIDNESYKPIFRDCLFILTKLSNKELDNFDRYLSIDEVVKQNGRTAELYYAVGANQSLALFYAFRNYLGKFVRK